MPSALAGGVFRTEPQWKSPGPLSDVPLLLLSGTEAPGSGLQTLACRWQTGAYVSLHNHMSRFPKWISVWAKSLQLCPTLCNPVDCRPSVSSVHGILQTRILEGVAMPFSTSYISIHMLLFLPLENWLLVKAMVFPVVMYGCESWTIKKAECRRIDAFELWCWRRLWRVPWTEGDPTNPSSRKSVLNIHWKDWCWSWNSNTLATWCKELTHLKRPWCWERLRAGGEGDDRGWDGLMASSTQWTWVWVDDG